MSENGARAVAAGLDPDEVLCVCRGITRGQLQAAIEVEGCNTLVSLTQKLGAGAECGACSAALAELLGTPLAWTAVTATHRSPSLCASWRRKPA